MFVVGASGDCIREYDLATAWDPATITLIDSSSVLSGGTTPTGIFWKPDGTRVFISDSNSDQISAYDTFTTYANTFTYTYSTTTYTAPVAANAAMFRVNVLSTTSTTTTTANILALVPLGTINSNGNVVLNSVSVFRSNIWEQFGTTLQNSTTTGAQFIRVEPSYIP
jgi:hypothetical protein